MDKRITDLIADGANLAVYRPYLDGLFTAYVHCRYIDYNGDGQTVEAAMEALADDITILRGERVIDEKVACFTTLIENGESEDTAAWLTDIAEWPV